MNGKAYDEPYLDEYKEQLIDGGALTEPFTLSDVIEQGTVPEDHLFVLGIIAVSARIAAILV